MNNRYSPLASCGGDPIAKPTNVGDENNEDDLIFRGIFGENLISGKNRPETKFEST